MSFHTQSKKNRNAGRALLTSKEKRIGMPWYAGEVWSARKAKMAQWVKLKVEASQARKVAREKLALASK